MQRWESGLVLAGALMSGACGQRGERAEEGPSAGIAQREVKTLGALNDARTTAACVPLADGRLLVAGGLTAPATTALSTVEIFAPATGNWQVLAPLAGVRTLGVGVQLANGEVLVVGGQDNNPLSTSEIYSVAKNEWRAGPPAARVRWNHALFKLLDGRVVAAGGYASNTPSSSVEIFDPIKGTWTDGPSLSTARTTPAWLTLADGRTLVIGQQADARGELLSADGTRWTPTPPMKSTRVGPALGQLPDGRIVVAGGLDAGGNALSTVELWMPGATTWIDGPTMGQARAGTIDSIGPRMVSLPGGGLLIGDGDQGALSRVFYERLDIGATAWADAGDAKYRVFGACAAPYPGGAIFAGGYDGESVYATEVYLGAGAAAACKSGDECASGTCAAGKCTTPPAIDAGPIDTGTDAPAAIDGAPPAAVSVAFERCQKDSECAAGHCADGVCCDAACREACHSCVLPGSIGSCKLQPLGLDLRGECGPLRSCTGTCGGDGKCVGSAAFAQCAAPHCTSISGGVGPSYCVASGVGCPSDEAATPFDCAPYTCEPAFGACRAGCVTSNDCIGAYVCDVATKTCVSPAPPGGGGGGCATGGDLGSASAAVPLAVLFGLALGSSRRRARRRRA